MTPNPPTPWIHIGECPVCVNGLVRIRACRGQSGSTHLFAMCDECEATWLEPTTESKRTFPDAENSGCPICSQPLYGPQSRWALPEDILASHDWSMAAIFELPSSDLNQSELMEPQSLFGQARVAANADDEDLLSLEDIATDGDAPALLPKSAAAQPQSPPSRTSEAANRFGDASYGQDDPKPGC